MSDHAMIVKEENVSLGTIRLGSPQEVILQATAVANELAKIVRERHLSNNIQGREFVKVEGWSTMGAMLGVLPREVPGTVNELDNGDWEATVELVRVSDGAIIGRGSAIVGLDETDRYGKPTWGSRPRYARRSMALTRATGKAYRLGFSWIMTLAGYEPTPLEEMDSVLEGQYREAPQEQKQQKPSTKIEAPKNGDGDRPYSPQTLRSKVEAAAEKFRNFTPTDKQQMLLRYGLDLCFAGDPASEDKRHTVLHYLTGKASTKDVDGQYFKAIVEKWLELEKSADGSGDYVVNPYAAKEAQAIVTAALKDEGQQELL